MSLIQTSPRRKVKQNCSRSIIAGGIVLADPAEDGAFGEGFAAAIGATAAGACVAIVGAFGFGFGSNS